MKTKIMNIAQSVRDRLKMQSDESGDELHFVIQRFVMERFLYRLGISEFRDYFILKGASLFFVWKGKTYRVTKDSDLLGYGSPDIDEIKKTFSKIAELSPEEEDGLVFSSDLVEVTRMKEGEEYDGARVIIPAKLTQASVKIQIDIGFGDAVVPAPEIVQYPTLLPFPPPTLRAYSVFSLVSEKFHAMCKLGMANSRMKDFHDI